MTKPDKSHAPAMPGDQAALLAGMASKRDHSVTKFRFLYSV